MAKKKEFISTRKLDFEVAPYDSPFNDGYDWIRFRVGTCEGLWTSTDNDYRILAVMNRFPNNGHFNDVLEWFEFSCKRDEKPLVIMDFTQNPKFKDHLINLRGFELFEDENVIKHFK